MPFDFHEQRAAVRQVVLDTETTGLNAKLGDRVIEIGCLELLNGRPTARDRNYVTGHSGRT